MRTAAHGPRVPTVTAGAGERLAG